MAFAPVDNDLHLLLTALGNDYLQTASTWFITQLDRGLRRYFNGNRKTDVIDILIQLSLVPKYVVPEYDDSPFEFDWSSLKRLCKSSSSFFLCTNLASLAIHEDRQLRSRSASEDCELVWRAEGTRTASSDRVVYLEFVAKRRRRAWPWKPNADIESYKSKTSMDENMRIRADLFDYRSRLTTSRWVQEYTRKWPFILKECVIYTRLIHTAISGSFSHINFCL